MPEFPLPSPVPRELEVWASAWTLPQAHVWARDAWRHRGVGMWVRQSVRCEDPKVSANHLAQLHRFADQIGLTDTGLMAMGYRMPDRQKARGRTEAPKRAGARDRLQVVPNGEAS